MTEVMAVGGKNLLNDFLGSSVSLIRRGLVDKERFVREAAAQAFDGLHQHYGSRAIDKILPGLL
jgi:hypothetical protein